MSPDPSSQALRSSTGLVEHALRKVDQRHLAAWSYALKQKREVCAGASTQIDHMVAGLEFKPVNQIASPTTKTGPPKPRHQSVIDSRVLVVETFNLFVG